MPLKLTDIIQQVDALILSSGIQRPLDFKQPEKVDLDGKPFYAWKQHFRDTNRHDLSVRRGAHDELRRDCIADQVLRTPLLEAWRKGHIRLLSVSLTHRCHAGARPTDLHYPNQLRTWSPPRLLGSHILGQQGGDALILSVPQLPVLWYERECLGNHSSVSVACL